MMKWWSLKQPSLPEKFSTEMLCVQNVRREALIDQFNGLKFLLRQGMAIRGHAEKEGSTMG